MEIINCVYGYFICFMACIMSVNGWQCPANETIRSSYVKSGEQSVLSFQTTLRTFNRQLVYSVVNYKEQSLYSVFFYNNVLHNEKVFNDSQFIGDIKTGNFTIKTAAVNSQNGGMYLLQYTEGTANLITLECVLLYVLGKPQKATITPDSNNILGRDSRLTCKSLSTTYPTNHTLNLVYNWKVNDVTNPSNSNKYVYSTSRNQLDIKAISKEDANTRLTCSATESGGSITGLSSYKSDLLTFQVIYGPDADTTKLNPPNTQYTLNEGVTLPAITCSGECYPSCNYVWTKSGTTVNNRAVLSIGQLTRTDAGIYICEVTNSNSTTISAIRKQVTVNVIFGPDTSTTSLTPASTSYTRNEGSSLDIIRCSGDCYPACNYKWTKTGSNRFTPVNNANLSLGSLHRDEAGTYTCSVSNPTSKREQTKAVSISVIFGPDARTTSLTPTTTSYTRYEGSSLDTLHCSGDCYPTCNYKWTKTGNNRYTPVNNANLSLGSLHRDESGTYTCTVSNPTSKQEQTKRVSISVIYGPDADSLKLNPSNSLYTENEGSSLNDITCSTACYPKCTYKWTKSGSLFIDGDVLSLGTLNKDKAAIYTCTAFNPTTKHNISTNVIVHVTFGPIVCGLNVPSRYKLTEGKSSSEMTCQAECYPKCTYSWTNVSSNSPVGINGKLQLINSKRYEAGTYKCLCENKPLDKRQSSSVVITIQYPPDVTVLQSTTNVTEGNNLTLTCNAKGVPSVYQYNSFTQTWNGVLIPNTNSEKFGTPKYSSLYIPSLQLQDSGTYSCFVNNGVNTTDSTSCVNIKVKGFPKVLTRQLTFTGTIGGETNISIQYYSFPVIQDVIFKSNDDRTMKNDTTKKYIVSHYEKVVKDKFYGQEVSLIGMQANLLFQKMIPDDFGGYTLILKNEIGEISTQFEIKSESIPSTPKSLYYFGRSNGVDTFIFLGGSNGGLLQTFVIETRINRESTWIEQLRFNETDKTYLQNEHMLYRFEIKGLMPNIYYVRVLAGNELGWIVTELAPMIKIKVYDLELREQSDQQVSDHKVAIVGGSLSFVIVGIIVVGVFIVRKKTCKNADKTSLQNTEGSAYDSLQTRQEANTTYSTLTLESGSGSASKSKTYENLETQYRQDTSQIL